MVHPHAHAVAAGIATKRRGGKARAGLFIKPVGLHRGYDTDVPAGKAVIKRMGELGVRLWKDKNGNDFWTQGGRAGMTKKMIYDFAERVIKAGWVTCPDQDLHSELQHIREQEGGAIEADSGYHDDLADAFCLALWNARKHIRYDGDEDVTKRIAKQKRERANNPLGY